jgi:hypothetical protein
MQAVVVNSTGGPEVLQLVHDHPVPKRGPGQVLVRVQSSSVNPVDTQLRAGTLPETVGGPNALEGKYPKVTAGVWKMWILLRHICSSCTSGEAFCGCFLSMRFGVWIVSSANAWSVCCTQHSSILLLRNLSKLLLVLLLLLLLLLLLQVLGGDLAGVVEEADATSQVRHTQALAAQQHGSCHIPLLLFAAHRMHSALEPE